MRLRATLIWEYDADPASYGTDSPLAMARIDQDAFADDPFAAMELALENGLKVRVRPCEGAGPDATPDNRREVVG